jgi:hypothetical protein
MVSCAVSVEDQLHDKYLLRIRDPWEVLLGAFVPQVLGALDIFARVPCLGTSCWSARKPVGFDFCHVVRLALSVVTVSPGQFLVPGVANVLPVHHAVVMGPGCFCAAEVGFVTLGFVAIVQVKVRLCRVVVVFPLSEREIGPIHVGLLTVG